MMYSFSELTLLHNCSLVVSTRLSRAAGAKGRSRTMRGTVKAAVSVFSANGCRYPLLISKI
jgi:hypothetical protein